MNHFQITQLTLTIEPTNIPSLSGQTRYQVDIYYKEDLIQENRIVVYLPIKEACYLWSWCESIDCHFRTNSAPLGLLKASKLACLLIQRKDIHFTSQNQAYQFFKQHCDPSKLRLLLGNDANEISIMLEKNPDHHVLGGYLGGESESKDKARFKAELTRQIKRPELIKLLIPEQCKNERGKRILNLFCQPLDCLTVILEKEDV